METLSGFRTIEKESFVELKEKGSRFLAFSFRISNEYYFKQHLAALKSKFPEASHYCFAYCFGLNGKFKRDFDNGEPKNSAGKPILRQIQSFQLNEVAVVVVRFFGGTKLGIPGLIKSYGEAAKMVLLMSDLVTVHYETTVLLSCDYQHEGLLYRITKQIQGRIIESEMKKQLTLRIKLPLAQMAILQDLLKSNYQITLKSTEND
jgi:uncharacterized YigZ family protein